MNESNVTLCQLLLPRACACSGAKVCKEWNTIEKLLLLDSSLRLLSPINPTSFRSLSLGHRDSFSGQELRRNKDQEILPRGNCQEAWTGLRAAYRNRFGIEKQSRSISCGYQCLLDRWSMSLRREIDEACR